MTLQQLRYVIQVVESGSFNSAAKALFISQPSLSKAIHDLEEEMSICLFVRTNKGILLSEQGEKFLGYARPQRSRHRRPARTEVQPGKMPFLQELYLRYQVNIMPLWSMPLLP